MLMAVAALATPAWAQEPGDPDAEGCKDSKLLTRMAGCTIVECSTKEFEATELQIKAVDPDTNAAPKQALEGAFEQLRYYCPAKYSLVQIQRNAENALKGAGFTIVFSGKSEDDWPMVTARKGAQWVSVLSREVNDHTGYDFTALKAQAMEQQLTADATSMAAEINKTGSVAIYGINFDTGKATLQAGSEAVLAEVLKLLQEHDEWKFEVQGHTDNVGPKAANLSLSEQRAKTVVSWLTGKGIAAARLVPKGYGDTAPVEANDTADGRAKNRRVELKKLNEE
jgi:outer membrane protein OmpA-like peptidoglycan-associated protein